MIHNLLVAIDREEAVPGLVAAVRALRGDVPLDAIVLHVRERQPRGVPLLSTEEAAGLVNRTVSWLGKCGVRASGRVEASLPSCIPRTILSVAEEEEAQAIVMGTYRRSGLTRWLQGGASRGVIGNARVPVFLVPLSGGSGTSKGDSGFPGDLLPKVVAVDFATGPRRRSGS